MEAMIRDLRRIETRLRRAVSKFRVAPVLSALREMRAAADTVAEAACGSWSGCQANVYVMGFGLPKPQDCFIELFGGKSPGNWHEYALEEVDQEIMQRAGHPDRNRVEQAAQGVAKVFARSRTDVLAMLDVLMAGSEDARLREFHAKIGELASHRDSYYYVSQMRPRIVNDRLQALEAPPMNPLKLSTQHFTVRAPQPERRIEQVPAHVSAIAWVREHLSYADQAEELAEQVRHIRVYVAMSESATGRRVNKVPHCVFIGHGHSPAWEELRDYLKEQLGLAHEEFKSAATAGRTTTERLETMLEKCDFAFLVMTAEDMHADGSEHPRDNVIHEAGLCQGRYGFNRAIILLEEGCAEFSNKSGLGHIPFPTGQIRAAFGEIRRVLEREEMIGTLDALHREEEEQE